jgi:flagellar secretion chaperone FliS
MSQNKSQYLESKILTAPPHRLHLMLIEGAIRFGRQAEKDLEAGNKAAAAPSLMRVLDIVGEMLAGIRQTKSEINDKLAAVYWFIFRRVSEATMESDKEALAEVLRLLEFERETWSKVCEKIGTSGNAPATVPPPTQALNVSNSTSNATGFSLQA